MNTEIYLILITFIGSTLFLYLYKKISYKFNILDIPNNLSVHSKKNSDRRWHCFFYYILFIIFIECNRSNKRF